MEASIGIMAYNEEKNIGNLLKTLLNQRLKFIKEIIVVVDGNEDRTAEIVKKFINNKKIKLINLKKRVGKVNAINYFLKAAKSNILILESADTLPEKNAIKKILEEFKDPKVGMVGARITPINKGKGFINFFGNFIYQLHHEIALKQPKFGELIAFRNVIKKVPITSVDEECLAMHIKKKNYKLKYCPGAIVYNKQPTNLRDIIKQRRRIHAGHLSLKKQDYRVSTTIKKNIISSTIKNLQLKKLHYIFLAILLEIWVKMLGLYDYYIKKDYHCVWEIAKSTKEVIKC